MTAPRRRRRRRLVPVLLVLLALLGLTRLPALRDLPRRLVEARLADAVQGEVALGALRLAGYPRLVLVDLRIGEAAILPWLRSARFPEVVAEVRLLSLLRGRVERLTVSGGRIELDARCDRALRLPDVAEGLELGGLSVGELEIGVRFAGRRTSVLADAELRPGAAPAPPWAGSVRLEADAADLEPLVVLLAGEGAPGCGTDGAERRLVARDLTMEVELLAPAESAASGGALQATARAGSLAVELADRRLVVSEPRLDLDWQLAAPARIEGDFELGALGRGRLEAELDGGSGMFRTFDGEVRGLDLGVLLPLVVAGVEAAEGKGDLHLRLGEEGVGSWEGEAKLAALTVDTGAGSGDIAGIELETRGRLDPSLGEAAVEIEGRAARGSFESAAGQSVEAVDLHLGAEGDVRLADRAPWIRLETLSTELAARLEPWGEIEVTAQFDPEASADSLRGRWSWHGAELARLRAHLEDPSAPARLDWELSGRADGSGELAGSLERPSVRGEISLYGLAVDSPDVGVAYRAETASLDFLLRPGGSLEARWSSTGEAALAELPTIPVRLEIAGSGAGGVLAVERGSVVLGPDGALGEIVATAEGSPGAAWRGTLEAKGAAVSGWYDLLRSQASSPLLPSGRVGGRWDWELTATGRWDATGSLTLEEGALASADGSRVISPLAWSWTVDADGDAEVVGARLRGEIGGFQLLWDAVFGDYGSVGLPIAIDVEGRRGAGSPRQWRFEGDATVDLAPGSSLRAHLGSASPESISYRLDARIGELAPVVEDLLRRPLAGGGGVVEQLTARGFLELELEGVWRERSGEGRGSVRTEGVDLELGEELAVEALDLDLPLDLAWRVGGEEGRGDLAIGGPVRRGAVRFGGLDAAGVGIPATSASLEVEGETVRLVERLSVPLLGGFVVLGDLRLSAGLSADEPGARLESAVELDGLDLAQITEVFGLYRLEGRVSGEFPHVVVAHGEMQTLGAGRLAFFDGQAILEQVAVTELFSRFPRVTFDARFEDLDLGQITRTLEFGEITGRVRGELRAVEVVGGTPVRFLGRFESVTAPGVPQVVSLKAANNLVLLGTGRSRALGGGLLPRLFDRFHYVGLGIELALSRDRFQLRGLLERGDKELFLKGRWPIRLDVVNVRPGATVSFETMMSRLDNLEIGRPQAEGGERR